LVTAIGRPEDDELACALSLDVVDLGAARSGLPGLLHGVGEFRNPRLDVRPHLLGPLVLGDHGQHVAERLELLVRCSGLLERLLSVEVFGCEVCRHTSSGSN